MIRRCIVALIVAMTSLTVAAAAYWVPSPSDTFQWDLEEPVPTNVPATVYDIDMFDNTAGLVAKLHAMGRHVICYIDVGSWESYRPDAKKYPKRILGERYPGYPQERFVDIRALDVLGPILEARFDLCKAKGFDAIEPDNMDTYQADTGFPLSGDDELRFISWLIARAHAHGLSIGQKNDPAQTPAVEGSFDWALLEECMRYSFCDRFSSYVADGKAVFDTEYTNHTTLHEFLHRDCPRGRQLGFFLIEKHLNLDAYRVTCDGKSYDLPLWQFARPPAIAP